MPYDYAYWDYHCPNCGNEWFRHSPRRLAENNLNSGYWWFAGKADMKDCPTCCDDQWEFKDATLLFLDALDHAGYELEDANWYTRQSLEKQIIECFKDFVDCAGCLSDIEIDEMPPIEMALKLKNA